MTRNTWITLIGSGVLCSAILVWQRAGIAQLENDVSNARDAIEELQAGRGDGHLIRKKPEIASADRSTSSKPDPSVTAPGTSPLLSAREFLEFVPDEKGDPAAMIRMLPGLLEKLEPYSADELFALVETLNKLTDQKQKAQSVTGLLLILLTGVEPERVLAFASKHEDASSPGPMQEVQTAAFSALARKDTVAARAFLEKADWSGRLDEQAQMALIRELARQELPAALAYIKERDFDERKIMSVLAVAARDPGVRENIRKTLATLEDPVMRDNLATGLVGATFTDSGFQGVSALLETMEFPDAASRDKALLGAANMALATQPAETVEWILRETSPEHRTEYLANSIRSWAYKDYNAAGAWLEAQAASAEKDAAVSAYATTVVNLDQEAAAVWTGQIEDESLRSTARRRVLTEWHRRNAEAAAAWMTEQGLNPSDWIPALLPSPAATTPPGR